MPLLLADAPGVLHELLVGEREPVAQVACGGGDHGDDRGHVAGRQRARVGQVLRRDLRRVFQEVDDARDLLGQGGVVWRADQAELTVERVVEVEGSAHVSSGYSSRMADAQVPVKSMAETQARRGAFLLPRIHGRASPKR